MATSAKEDEDFKKFLFERGYWIRRVNESDGNSIFRVIGNGLSMSHLRVRRQLSASLLTRYSEYGLRLEQLQRIRSPGAALGPEIIRAVSELFKVNIILFQPPGRRTNCPPDLHYPLRTTIMISQHDETVFHRLSEFPPSASVASSSKTDSSKPSETSDDASVMSDDEDDNGEVAGTSASVTRKVSTMRVPDSPETNTAFHSNDELSMSGNVFSMEELVEAGGIADGDDEDYQVEFGNLPAVSEFIRNDTEQVEAGLPLYVDSEVEFENLQLIPESDYDGSQDAEEHIPEGSQNILVPDSGAPQYDDIKGYHFVANRKYARGRERMAAICFVPITLLHEMRGDLRIDQEGIITQGVLPPFHEVMRHASNTRFTLPYTILYCRSYLSRPRLDADLRKVFVLYRTFIPKPTDLHERRKWVVNILLPHFILHSIRWEHHGVEMPFHVCASKLSLLVRSIYQDWNDWRAHVMERVTNIVTSRISPFCFCVDGCAHQNMLDHLSIYRFHPLEYLPSAARGFMFDNTIFSAARRNSVLIMEYIREIYFQGTEEENYLGKMNDVIALIDYNSDIQSGVWTMYVAVVVNGRSMENFQPKLATDLQHHPEYKVVIYVGSHKGHGICPRHFHVPSDAGINQLLSREAKVYTLLLREFTSESSARFCESRVHETLRVYLENRMNLPGRLPYHLANLNSMPAEMQNLTNEQILEMLRFAQTNVPVFIADESQIVENFQSDFFTGNYKLEPYNMPDGSYTTRTFDNVEKNFVAIQHRFNDQDANFEP